MKFFCFFHVFVVGKEIRDKEDNCFLFSLIFLVILIAICLKMHILLLICPSEHRTNRSLNQFSVKIIAILLNTITKIS